MSRRSVFLLALLVPCLALTAWVWTRPYAWHPDPAARAEIRFARLEHDHGYHWLDLQLKITGAKQHDLTIPVRLVTAAGREIEPAETTLEGSADRPIDAISLKFWLEPGDLDGPLDLRINGGTLTVRERDSAPPVPASPVFHRNSDW